jgi:hypothetical protein
MGLLDKARDARTKGKAKQAPEEIVMNGEPHVVSDSEEIILDADEDKNP